MTEGGNVILIYPPNTCCAWPRARVWGELTTRAIMGLMGCDRDFEKEQSTESIRLNPDLPQPNQTELQELLPPSPYPRAERLLLHGLPIPKKSPYLEGKSPYKRPGINVETGPPRRREWWGMGRLEGTA